MVKIMNTNKTILVVMLAAAACFLGGMAWADEINDAAQSGDLATVEQLLAQGADVNSTANGGATPLHWAAGNDHKEMAELLLAHGADVNARDNFGQTPLGVAGEGFNEEMIELLRQRGGEE